MEAQDIYNLVKHGTPAQLREFIHSAPENTFKPQVLSILDTSDSSTKLIFLTTMVMEYCHGRSPKFGAALAEAVHRIASEVFESEQGRGHILLTTLSNLATQHLNALNLLGKATDVIRFSENYIERYRELNDAENLPSLINARAVALLNLGRVDESEKLLLTADFSANPGAEIERRRLLGNIAKLKGNATAVKHKIEEPSLRNLLADVLENGSSSIFDSDPVIKQSFMAMLHDEQQSRSLDTNKIGDYQHLLDLLDKGNAWLNKGSSEVTERNMESQCRRATSIFHPGRTSKPTEPELLNSLKALQEVRAWAESTQSTILYNDALWGSYLCYSRLDKHSDAANALIRLRMSLEAQRAGIVNPIERGGAFSTYPALFSVLCERLHKSGRYLELLESIEASKGRAVADILTRKKNLPVPDADIYAAVARLPGLAAKHCFNYLSFYVDRYDGRVTIYSVLLSETGEIHSCDPVVLEENLFDNALACLDPSEWGAPGFRGRVKPNASSVLAPLATLLETLLDDDVLQIDDHICYTADEQLNNVPLHYLPFKDGLLIDYFSFSRVHNAAQLEHVLSEPDTRPEHAVVCIVPTKQDKNNKHWSTFENNIARPAISLVDTLDTRIMRDQEVNIKNLSTDIPGNSILHFSTHGVTEVGVQNPYTHSGLVISDGKELPDKEEIARGNLECVLTPQKVVDCSLDLHQCHISLMACVSGISREGIGGDALGLDWAFANAGVRSMLYSHWFISAKMAAEFFDIFYSYWLKEKQSKANAFRNTIRKLQESGSKTDALNSMHQWSAFSLSGDWR